MNVEEIRRVVVFRALFLGDLLCVTPAFRMLRARFPRAEITLISLPWARSFAARFPHYIDRFVEFQGYPGVREVPAAPQRTADFLRAQQEYGYDLAINLHGSGHISNGFVAGLGARCSLGYRSGPDDRLTHAEPYPLDMHEVVRWARLVTRLGAPLDDLHLEFPISPAEEREANSLLALNGSGASSRPLVGLHTGAKEAQRRWPPERFAVLADQLVRCYHARIVLTGSEAERETTAAVSHRMASTPLDLAGHTDLGAFAAILRRLDLLVTNDTGASHLAAAVGAPSVVLFGFTAPAEWAPLDRDRHRVVDARALDEVEPEVALQRLPVEPVFAACDEMLQRFHSRSPAAPYRPPNCANAQPVPVPWK